MFYVCWKKVCPTEEEIFGKKTRIEIKGKTIQDLIDKSKQILQAHVSPIKVTDERGNRDWVLRASYENGESELSDFIDKDRHYSAKEVEAEILKWIKDNTPASLKDSKKQNENNNYVYIIEVFREERAAD